MRSDDVDVPAQQREVVKPTPRTVDSVAHDMESGEYTVRLDGAELVTTRSAEVANALLRAKKDGHRVLLSVDAATAELIEMSIAPASTGPATEKAGGTGKTAAGPRIKKIEQLREGKRNDGSIWRHRKIVTDAGEEWFTFDDKVVATAEDAIAKGWPVRIVRGDENPKYPDQLNVETITLIDPRQGTLPMDEGGDY